MDGARIGLLLISGGVKETDRLSGVIGELQDSRFETVSVQGLEEGFEHLADQRIDVALLDNSLLGYGWVQVFRELRSKAPETAVILLVDEYDPVFAAKALRTGVCDCLVKNEVDSTSLTRAIHFAIERRRDARLKEKFMSDASHELRTPLAVLKIAVCNMRKGLASARNEELEKMLRMAELNVDHLGKFLNNLLDLARLESGRENFNCTEISLETVIHEVLASFETDAKNREITVEVAAPPDLPAVFADEYMMEKIFNNLLSNALRFARNKVSVQLKKREGKLLPPEILLCHPGDDMIDRDCFPEGVLISVVDDGVGIPGDGMGGLFDKFVQLKNINRSDGHRGTGLGLAISKEMVNRHNGLIWAENNADQGARFNVVIPSSNGKCN